MRVKVSHEEVLDFAYPRGCLKVHQVYGGGEELGWGDAWNYYDVDHRRRKRMRRRAALAARKREIFIKIAKTYTITEEGIADNLFSFARRQPPDGEVFMGVDTAKPGGDETVYTYGRIGTAHYIIDDVVDKELTDAERASLIAWFDKRITAALEHSMQPIPPAEVAPTSLTVERIRKAIDNVMFVNHGTTVQRYGYGELTQTPLTGSFGKILNLDGN
jgi:hypothetical protein